MKTTLQYFIWIISVLLFTPLFSYASSWDVTINAGNFVTEALSSKWVSISKILDKPQDQKDIDTVKDIITDFKIKSGINSKLLEEVKKDIQDIQKKIQENESEITTLSWSKDSSLEFADKYESLQKENQKLKNQVFFKESLINDLKESIDSYKLLEVKYEDVLNKYVDTQREKEKDLNSVQNQKFFILFLAAFIFIVFYFLKIFLKKKDFIKKGKDNFYVYYDLFYAITLIIFTITYLFYLFPQLYILLVFVSGSIIWANAILISSFVSSLIIFRKFVVGDIIWIWPDIGKIVKITPLHTIIRKINEHGIIEGDEVSIPNINLIKDTVNVINDIHLKDHYFSIILTLKDNEHLFQIVDEIRENILLKFLTHRPHSINPYDEDIFKTKYEYIDSENVKITFYWIGPDELNRKIEKKIISYAKGVIFDSLEKKSVLKLIDGD